jgi:hypothetical protein
MTEEMTKEVAKLVKDWAVSVGIPRNKLHVRSGKGRQDYIHMWVSSESSPNIMDPLRYDHSIPHECCNRMLKVIYPNSEWVKDSCSAGNVSPHSISAVAAHWVQFLAGERALQVVPV